MDNNLKDYREKELKNYIIGNALMIIVLSGIFDTLLDSIEMNKAVNNVFLTLSGELISVGIFSSILYTYVFILDAIIPGNWKDMICNLCRPCPGEVIFKEMKEKVNDRRFTKEEILQRYSTIYEKLENLTEREKRKVSNSAWYAIYCKHQNESTLYIGLMYFVLYAFSMIGFNCRVVIVLIIELVATNIAMRGKQRRFAYNVIAADIHLT